jgi:Asp/Glu/hydantoin racemase
VTTKIQVIHPIGTSLYNDYTVDLLGPLAAPSIEIEVTNLEGLSDEPFVFSPESVNEELVGAVKKAERDGVAGVIVACASDPGIEATSKEVSVPVTGPFSALASLGHTTGRLGIIAAGYKIDTWRPRAVSYGLEENLVSVRKSDISHPSDDLSNELLAKNPELLLKYILDEMRRSIAEEAVLQATEAAFVDGVDTLFFACTLWSGLLEPVRAAVPGVKVLDPLVSPLRYLEYLLGV